MKTAGEENPNSQVRLYNEPTESMGRKLRTILAHSHGLKSKKKSGRRRGVSLDFSFYRTSRDLAMGFVNITAYIMHISRKASAGKFVVSMGGEAYATKARDPNRISRKWPFKRYQMDLR